MLYDGQCERCTLFDSDNCPQPMTVEELRAGLHHLGVRLYGEELTEWRKENFNRKYLRTTRHAEETES